jgi:hypothetical protein
METRYCRNGEAQVWLVCTTSDGVHDGCPVLHVLPGAHTHQDALLVAVVRHACVAAQQGSAAVPVSVEILAHTVMA